ncbi:conserved domain protein [Bacteroides fluxus YIT 12057]|uniref:Conserved domain protein n=1 Tax=Bacteroides fluxus YIT 12057 TaxID=763034 RepID=F3PWB5_9BACE|nr:conserved domain protein [Bacteroides fluxus YIT 12057]
MIGTIISSIANEDYNIVMIDECDNGLYYSTHKLMWKTLLKFIKRHDFFTITMKNACILTHLH